MQPKDSMIALWSLLIAKLHQALRIRKLVNLIVFLKNLLAKKTNRYRIPMLTCALCLLVSSRSIINSMAISVILLASTIAFHTCKISDSDLCLKFSAYSNGITSDIEPSICRRIVEASPTSRKVDLVRMIIGT